MFTLEDREICKNFVYKERGAGECEKTIKGYDEYIPDIENVTHIKLQKKN